MDMIKFGVFSIYWYGLMVGLGIFFGFWVVEKVRLKLAVGRKTLRKICVWDGMWWVVIPRIVLARLYHVIDYWSYYRENIILILQLWNGGMGIFGAILGGALGLWLYTRKKGVKFASLVDLAAFGLPIGQAIGRWGNFFNQELYGKPFGLVQGKTPFWAIYIDSNNRISGYENYSYYHPLFLYESLWSLLTFGVIYFLLRKRGGKLNSGVYFSIYLVMYGLGRFCLEFLRIEPWNIGGINVAHVISFTLIVTGSFFLLRYMRK